MNKKIFKVDKASINVEEYYTFTSIEILNDEGDIISETRIYKEKEVN